MLDTIKPIETIEEWEDARKRLETTGDKRQGLIAAVENGKWTTRCPRRSRRSATELIRSPVHPEIRPRPPIAPARP